MTFAEGELGKPYEVVACETEAVSPSLPQSFQTLLQGEIFQENVQPAANNENEDFHLAYEDDQMTLDTPVPPCQVPLTNKLSNTESSVRNSPRRVQLITISSPRDSNKN